MARLLKKNLTAPEVIAEQIITADSMLLRMKGLLLTNSIAENKAMWIRPCNSVHTMFMRYTIDVILMTKELKVCGLESQLTPWRMILPNFKAQSVFEMAAGSIKKKNLQIGDQLYVDP